MVKQSIFLILLAAIVGLAVNRLSPRGVDIIGKYRELSGGEGPIVPPTAEPGDPPFIDINVAQLDFTTKTALFVDARDPEEFACATIPGALSVPFEYLPDDLEPYLDSVFREYGRDYPLVIFCSGEECDLSVQLARTLQDFQFTNLSIFFGGAREWEKSGLEMQRSPGCDQ